MQFLSMRWLGGWLACIAFMVSACTPPLVELGADVPDRVEGQHIGSWRVRGSGGIVPKDIAIDAKGTMYILGSFPADALIDDELIAPGLDSTHKIGLFALGSNGAVRWVVPTVGSSAGFQHVFVHPEGGVVFAFHTGADISVNGVLIERGPWVIRASASGEILWKHPLHKRIRGLALDSDNNVYTASNATSPTLEALAVVDKLNSNGELQWQQELPFFPVQLTAGEAGTWATTVQTSTNLAFEEGELAIDEQSVVVVEYLEQTRIRTHVWPQDQGPQYSNTTKLTYSNQGLEIWAKFVDSFEWGGHELTAPIPHNTWSPEAYFQGYIASDGQMSLPQILAGTRLEELYSVSALGESSLAAGIFRGILELGDGRALFDAGAEDTKVFVAAYDADPTRSWAFVSDLLISDMNTMEVASNAKGDVALMYGRASGPEIQIEQIRVVPVQNDSLTWRDRCSSLYAPEEIAQATSLARPEVSPSNEVQPIFSSSCYDAGVGSLVRIYRDAACEHLVTAAVVHDGSFEAEVALQAIPWDGSADGTLDFYASVNSDIGEALVECVALDASYELDSGHWEAISTLNAPGERFNQTSFWTGSEMLVWGGQDPFTQAELDDGARYNPVTDTWTPINNNNKLGAARREYVAAWAEERQQMFIWGGDSTQSTIFGLKNDGAIYDLASDTWTKIPDAPLEPTADAVGVWSGSELIVWGGRNPSSGGTGANIAGARYDPDTDAWTLMTPSEDTPAARQFASAVWTGSEMFVWGGSDVSPDGGRYDPVSDTWRSFAMPAEWDIRTAWHPKLVWDGTWVWVTAYNHGSGASNKYLLARFDPVTEEWMRFNSLAIQSLVDATFDDRGLTVFGRCDAQASSDTSFGPGAMFLEDRDTWRWLPTLPGTPKNCLASIIWTGTELIVWGGQNIVANEFIDPIASNTGYRYVP